MYSVSLPCRFPVARRPAACPSGCKSSHGLLREIYSSCSAKPSASNNCRRIDRNSEGEMRLVSSLLFSALFAVAAFGQTGAGSLSGSLAGPANAPLPGMTVEAKNIATGTDYKAISSPKGQYTFSQLPAGTYEVTVLSLLFSPYI